MSFKPDLKTAKARAHVFTRDGKELHLSGIGTDRRLRHDVYKRSPLAWDKMLDRVLLNPGYQGWIATEVSPTADPQTSLKTPEAKGIS